LNEAYVRGIRRASRMNKDELTRAIQDDRESELPLATPTSLAEEAETLQEVWTSALVSANASTSRLDQRSAHRLERLSDEFAKLVTVFASKTPYDGWARSEQFVPFLEVRQTLDQAVRAAMTTGMSWDVVNAAWRSRLKIARTSLAMSDRVDMANVPYNSWARSRDGVDRNARVDGSVRRASEQPTVRARERRFYVPGALWGWDRRAPLLAQGGMCPEAVLDW